MKQKIILASGSPRRKDLLTQIWLDFKIIPSLYEEDMTIKISNAKLVKKLAYWKAKDVAKKLDSWIVIWVDTYVVFDGNRLWKPKTSKKAKNYLKMISWKTIKVYSWISIIDIKNKKEVFDYEITKVKMKKLSSKEIDLYIKTWEPIDKAWAFGMQWIWAIFIEKIDGCYSNIIWLPLNKLYINLKKLWIDIL